MTQHTWLEVSLIVEPEMAESVAEVLSRYVPNGVAIESTDVITTNNQYGEAGGPLKVAAYLKFDDQTEHIRQKIEESLWYLGRIRPIPKPNYKTVNDADWAEAWKAHYRPITIGDRLLILPAWYSDYDEGDRLAIRMDPGMAFGTGTHPTTQLCLIFLEEFFTDTGVDPIPGISQTDNDVIDIGCGSGILSVAALKLGANRVLAVDNDPLAVNIARENAVLNQVTNEHYMIEVGSLDDIRSQKYIIGQAQIVVANILAPILIQMLDSGLSDLLRQDGILILSGIIDNQVEEIRNAITRNGLEILREKMIDDWVALAINKV